MATNNVFANSLEIACKAAVGKAIAAAPDVCMSPPPPPAGPVPIPYANTAYAKDTTNGSKTVFISGKPVTLRDKSYMKTSTGNEAATQAFAKGVVSGKIKGKCYFISWSPNVMVEGFNVCRHTDSTTHNHGSPGNTGPWKYLDTTDKSAPCKDEKKEVQKKCKPKPKKTWKQTHCQGLNSKQDNTQDKKARQNATPEGKSKALDLEKQLREKGKRLASELETLTDSVQKKIAVKSAKVAGKAAAKGFLGPVGWLWTAYDVIDTALEAQEMLDNVLEFKEKLADFKKDADRLMNLKKELGQTGQAFNQAMAEMATSNPCTRAKRCQLQSYNASTNKTSKTGGCCPGQTGHHLLPKSYMQTGDDGKAAATATSKNRCSNYNAGKAPVVCLEGISHNQGGTHDLIHTIQDKNSAKALDGNNDLSYKEAKDSSIKSLKSATGAPCSSKCLEAQLDNYHKEACPQLKEGSSVNPVSATNGNRLERPVDKDFDEI